MEYYYAIIDEKSFCTDIITSTKEETAENMISINSHDTDLIWKKYENGEFIEADPPKPEETESKKEALTENEILMLALADLYAELQSLKEGK